MGGSESERDRIVVASVRRALAGEVFPALRAVRAVCGPNAVTIVAYVDSAISPDDAEALSRVETEVMADLLPEVTVTHEVIRCDAPQPIAETGLRVFDRSGQQS
jgi:hypothetical protein